MSNYIVNRWTNSSSTFASASGFLNTASGTVVGVLGVPRFPVQPGTRRGVISFQNNGSGSIFLAPQSDTLQSSSWFTSSTQGCIVLTGAQTPPVWLDFPGSDDVWMALSQMGAGDSLVVIEQD
jgi:hypothetical protein